VNVSSLTASMRTGFSGTRNLGGGHKSRPWVYNNDLITHTPLHIYVVYIMLSVASSVALSGSTHRKNEFEGGKGRKGGVYSHGCAIS